MVLQQFDVHDLPPPAEAIFNKLGHFLSGFGRPPAGATLVIVQTGAGDAIPELRLAMFLRDEAEAGEIKASRMIGDGGVRAAAAQMSAALCAREGRAPSAIVTDKNFSLAVVVATRNPGDVIRAATEFGLVAQRMARSDTRRALSQSQGRRRRARPTISAWPIRDSLSLSPR